ncbi:MAG: STAS domain-containing protein [Myxococcota bacterium]
MSEAVSSSTTPSSPFPLPEELVLSACEELQEALITLLRSGGPVRLDGGSVARCDAAALQLLLALAKDAQREGRPFAIVNPSPAFADGTKLLALTEEFGSGSDPHGGDAQASSENTAAEATPKEVAAPQETQETAPQTSVQKDTAQEGAQ